METIADLGVYTFPALLSNTLKKFADRPSVAFVSETPISYTEFGKRVEETRTLLFRLGVSKGDRVALYSQNSPNWGIAYFAIVTSGAIAVPLLPDFTAKEVDTCIRHAGATTLIISSKLADRIPDPTACGIQAVLHLEDFSVKLGSMLHSGSFPDVQISEEDTASIIYTSGTTGRSKGVELTHKNLVFTAEGSQFFQRINKYDVGLSILPLSHVYEFTIGFLLFFLNGASIFYLGKPPTVTTLLPALLEVRPTIMLSVPIIMEKIYKNKIVPAFTTKATVAKLYKIPLFRKILHRLAGKSLKKTFGGRIKFFGIGGAKVDPIVERFLKEAKFPYAIGYGLTETSPLLAGSGPKVTKPGTIGKTMPGIELKILDPDPVTGLGEVAARGPNVMKGYYNDPEMTASVMTTDGWFRTGDIGMFGSQARLALKGRSKNMILGPSGENIYPEDIEFVLNQHPFVSEALVVEGDNASLVALVQVDADKIAAEAKRRHDAQYEGRPLQAASDAVSGAVTGAMNEMSQMFVYKKEEILNEIKFFVNSNVNRISRIDRVELIDQFEKTASQKIKRYLYNMTHNVHHGKI